MFARKRKDMSNAHTYIYPSIYNNNNSISPQKYTGLMRKSIPGKEPQAEALNGLLLWAPFLNYD